MKMGNEEWENRILAKKDIATALGATEWPSNAYQDGLFPLVEIHLA